MANVGDGRIFAPVPIQHEQKKRYRTGLDLTHPLASLFLLFALSMSRSAFPQETQQQMAEPIDLEQLSEFESVVVAERYPIDEFESARSVSVVDTHELSERTPRTTPEALWDAPGVFIQQTNHGGGSPIIRGMIGPQNLILLEGVRLNNSVYRTGPLQYLNLIDPLSVERLEVLRGPGSVLYGSDAMGGVLQVRLLSPDRPLGRHDGVGMRLVGRTGSVSSERTIHGIVQGRGRDISVLGGTTFKALGDLMGGRDTGRQEYSGYDQWSALARYHWAALRTSSLRLSLDATLVSSAISNAGRTDQLEDKGSLQMYDNTDHLVYTRLRLAYPRLRTSGELTLSFQHFFERKDTHSLDESRTLTESTVRDEVTAQTLGLDFQLMTTVLDERLRFRYGGMWYRDWVGADRYHQVPGTPFEASGTTSYPPGSTYDNYGAFLLLDGEPLRLGGDHSIRLSGGYRLHGMASFAPATELLDEGDSSYLGHVFFGSVQYLMLDHLNLALTFSQGFRAPNLNESAMIGDTGKYFHIPNSNLRPERSDTFEFLVQTHVARFSAGVSGYLSLIDDLIRREETTRDGTSEVNGKPVAWNINSGLGLIWGVEGNLALEIGWGLSLLGSITSTRGAGDVGQEKNVPLSRIPPLFGRIALRLDRQLHRGLVIFAEGYVRGAMRQDRLSPEDERDVRIPEGGTPGWWTINIRGGVELHRVFALRASVENLANVTYRYHGSGIDGPGIGAFVAGELYY